MNKRYSIILFVLLFALIAAVPVYQTATRFRALIVQDAVTVGGALTVSGASTFNGATTLTGAVNQSGLQTLTGGLSVAPNAVIAAPTALATATPVLYVNSAGAHNLVVVAKNATPVWSIRNSGAVVGLVEQSNQSGVKCVYGTQTVTGTGTIAHGLSTPVAVQLTLAQDVTVDSASLSYTNAAAVVTAKVWQIPVTPAAIAAATPAIVAYRVCGTP